MGVPNSEVGYTPAMPRREGHKIHKGHLVALEEKKKFEQRDAFLSFLKAVAVFVVYVSEIWQLPYFNNHNLQQKVFVCFVMHVGLQDYTAEI